MPAWPDILSKYNVLLSQTHNFSTALLQPFPTSTAVNGASSSSSKTPALNIYERIALHPNVGMMDTQLDGEVVPLLRNQQTTDVLRMENDTVRRLAEHMVTRGSLGVLGILLPPAPAGGFGGPAKKPEYEDVLKECEEIRGAHDRRVDRAIRAVEMLKEKFDWKQRMEVTVEEPEELDFDPRYRLDGEVAGQKADEDEGMGSVSSDGDESDDDEDDEYNVEGALFNPDVTSPLDVDAS